MEDSLWLCSGARCVQNEERMLRIKALCNMFCALSIDNLMPPDIGCAIPRSLLFGALDYKNLLNIGLALERFIYCRLKRKCRAFSESTICCNDKFCISILNTREKCICRETAEDDRMCSANSSAGKHCDCSLWNHRHINRNAIASLYTDFNQRICRLLHIS